MYVEEGVKDPSFVEQDVNCQEENMSHHGGGEGCGCGERSLWYAGMGVGKERKRDGSTFRGGGNGFVSKETFREYGKRRFRKPARSFRQRPSEAAVSEGVIRPSQDVRYFRLVRDR